MLLERVSPASSPSGIFEGAMCDDARGLQGGIRGARDRREIRALLTDEEHGWLSFADHLAYAGVKLPPLQNECFKAATRGGRGYSRLRFAKHVVKLRDARKAMAAEKNGKLCPGAALTEGQYNAYGAAGCADFCKKVTTWYTKSVRKGEVKAGETRWATVDATKRC